MKPVFNGLTLFGFLVALGLGSRMGFAGSAADFRPDYRVRATNAITGHCTVLGSVGSPLPSACDHLTLILSTPEGKPLGRAQTDLRGNFQFSAKLGTKYVLSLEEPKPKIVSPPGGAVTGGDVLDLKVEP